MSWGEDLVRQLPDLLSKQPTVTGGRGLATGPMSGWPRVVTAVTATFRCSCLIPRLPSGFYPDCSPAGHGQSPKELLPLYRSDNQPTIFLQAKNGEQSCCLWSLLGTLGPLLPPCFISRFTTPKGAQQHSIIPATASQPAAQQFPVQSFVSFSSSLSSFFTIQFPRGFCC